MKVSLDNGDTWVEVENLKVIQNIEDPTDYEDDPSSEIYLNIGDNLVNH